MAKPLITLRSSTAPSPLTYAQLDQNFTNLQNATISLEADTAGTTVTSDLNGKITIVAGTGVTVTGDNTAKTITITNTSLGANSFGKIVVSGQSDVDADTTADTLTLVAGTGVNITTNASTDTITIEAAGSAGTGTINAGISGRLTYYPASGTTVDDIPNINYDDTNNILNLNSILKLVPASSAVPNMDVTRIGAGGVDGSVASSGVTLDFPNFAGIIVIARRSVSGAGDIPLAIYKCIKNQVAQMDPTVDSSIIGTVTYESTINGYRWTNSTGNTIFINHFSIKMFVNSN